MALVRIAATRAAFDTWANRLGWAQEAAGVRANPKTSARAVWQDGAIYVRVSDDKPALAATIPILLEREFGGKATTPAMVPEEVSELLGELEAIVTAGAPPSAPASAPPGDSPPAPEVGEAAGADAKAAVAAADVGSQIGGAVEGAAEKAREALDAAKARHRQASAAGSKAETAASEEEREAIRRLREMGLDVGESAAPQSGFIVSVSIVTKTRLTRVIDRTSYTRKYFRRLGDRADIIENARRRARRHIDGEGGTPFMGTKLVPANRLPILLKKLHELRDEFHHEIDTEIGGHLDEINEEIEAAVRKHAKREPTTDDLLPPDVRTMFEYRIEIARMAIPRVSDLQDVDVDLDTAREAIDNVLRTSREVTEKAVLRRFAVAYKSLSQAWESVSQKGYLNGQTKAYLRDVVSEMTGTDTTRNPVVRAELEKLRAYVEFVLEAAEARELNKAQPALAKAVGRVVAVHNATAPMTGADELTAPPVGSVRDGLKAITEQIQRDMESNEERYGLSVEPPANSAGGKVNIRAMRHDGSPESARKAWLAYAQQFERLVVKG